MNYRTMAILTMAVLFAFIFSILPGCDTKTPVTSQTIKIGYIMPMTGPAAEKGAPIGQGQLDAIKYINDELRGAEGNKLEEACHSEAWCTGGSSLSSVVVAAC